MWADLLFRLRSVFQKRAVEDELDEEMRFHFAHEVDAHMRQECRSTKRVAESRLSSAGWSK